MGLSNTLLLVLDGSEAIHQSVVAALRADVAAESSAGASVASESGLTVVSLTTYEQPDAAYLSSHIPADVAALGVMIFDSDIAAVEVYEAGTKVAHAMFGLDIMDEMFDDLDDADGDGDSDEDAEEDGVAVDAIFGIDWWTTHLKTVSPEQVHAIVNADYVFVEQQVHALLAPLGITPKLIGSFASEVIARPGTARVTAV